MCNQLYMIFYVCMSHTRTCTHRGDLFQAQGKQIEAGLSGWFSAPGLMSAAFPISPNNALLSLKSPSIRLQPSHSTLDLWPAAVTTVKGLRLRNGCLILSLLCL